MKGRTDPGLLSEHCLFCDPGVHDQGSQVLLLSDHFYLFAGLGPILDGYTIITTRTCVLDGVHLTCLRDLPPDWIDELVYLRGLVSAFYRDVYGQDGELGHPGISFEHGRAGSCFTDGRETRHCYHPHLCCYPGVRPARRGFSGMPKEPFLWHGITDFPVEMADGLHALHVHAGRGPYLYIEHCDVDPACDELSTARERWESVVVFPECENSVKSQYLRRLLATQVGREHLWDWEKYPGIEKVETLCRQFSCWLEHESSYDVSWEGPVPQVDFLSSSFQMNRMGSNRIAGTFFQRRSEHIQTETVERFLHAVQEMRDVSGLSQVGGAIRILDAGCGPGVYVKHFNDRGFHCAGVDASSEMLANAARFVSVAQSGDASGEYAAPLVEADICALPLADASFDGVWCSAVLLHMPRRGAVPLLEELHRVLKKAGVLYLSVRCGVGAEMRPEGRQIYSYEQAELEKLLAESGFRMLESWFNTTEHGTTPGDNREKTWMHCLLGKATESVDGPVKQG